MLRGKLLSDKVLVVFRKSDALEDFRNARFFYSLFRPDVHFVFFPSVRHSS